MVAPSSAADVVTQNRATKAGGFVREGCHVAKAAVVLRNRGTDAYMPDTYGHSITIERTLRSNGTGAYKISAADKTVVDTKKATLDAIRESELRRTPSAEISLSPCPQSITSTSR